MKNKYENPLCTRYASSYLINLFSSDVRYITWRKLWLELATAQKELGLNISDLQINELKDHLTDIDYDVVSKKEKEIRHDVMAHIFAYGEVAPNAKPIIHLGATSCYVTDNADLIIYRDALLFIRSELKEVMSKLVEFISKYSDMPMLGYTHYQPAQLVTVGKRASLWLQDLMLDLEEIEDELKAFRFLGSRGTTGTEASFLELFDNDEEKIDLMNQKIANKFGFEKVFDVSGQTYPRKFDSRLVHCLSSIAESANKFATDLRLLQHDRLIEEPYETKQVGSSAMPYKHNPMRCERICSLSRYVLTVAMNPSLTSSTQWFERTLDDSANRRISIPECFLATDSVLKIMNNVVSNLVVNEKIVEKQVNEYLPFIASENLMMAAVKNGGDRQEIHEVIRECSNVATARMKEGLDCNLLELLAERKEFYLSLDELKDLMNPKLYTGRSSKQALKLCDVVKTKLSEIEDVVIEDLSL